VVFAEIRVKVECEEAINFFHKVELFAEGLSDDRVVVLGGLAELTFLVHGPEASAPVFQNPDGAAAGAVEHDVVCLPGAVVIVREAAVQDAPDVVTTETLVERRNPDGEENAAGLADDAALAGTVAEPNEMVEPVRVCEVEREYAVLGVGEVAALGAADTWASAGGVVDGGPVALEVAQNDEHAFAWAVADEEVALSAVVHVEGEGVVA